MKRNPISFSIWLSLGDNENEYFNGIISRLSQEYNSPLFPPHITLLSGFLGDEDELLISAKKFSKELKIFKVKIGQLMQLNEIFTSLFFEVKKNTILLFYHKTAKKHFNFNQKLFFPHISLVYGMFSNDLKNEMKKKIKNPPTHSIINSITLAYNDEKNLKWKILQRFELGRK